MLEEKTEPTQVEKKNEWNERLKLYFVSSFHSVDEIEDGERPRGINSIINRKKLSE